MRRWLGLVACLWQQLPLPANSPSLSLDEGGADSPAQTAVLAQADSSTNRATCEMAGHGLRDSMRSMDIGSSSGVGMRNGSVTESMCCRGQRAEEGTLGYGHSRCGRLEPALTHVL